MEWQAFRNWNRSCTSPLTQGSMHKDTHAHTNTQLQTCHQPLKACSFLPPFRSAIDLTHFLRRCRCRPSSRYPKLLLPSVRSSLRASRRWWLRRRRQRRRFMPFALSSTSFLSKGGALPGRGPRQSRDEGRHFIHTELPAYSQNTPGKGICCQTSTTTGNYGVLLNSVHSITSHARLW